MRPEKLARSRAVHPHEMQVFDDFLSKMLTNAVNLVLQLSDFCSRVLTTFATFGHFLVTFALLGSFLAEPGPPEANRTARTFKISLNF